MKLQLYDWMNLDIPCMCHAMHVHTQGVRLLIDYLSSLI